MSGCRICRIHIVLVRFSVLFELPLAHPRRVSHALPTFEVCGASCPPSSSTVIAVIILAAPAGTTIFDVLAETIPAPDLCCSRPHPMNVLVPLAVLNKVVLRVGKCLEASAHMATGYSVC